jgi:hypothetical protein
VKGDFSEKDCLILSYEDYSIPQVANDFFEKKHDLYLGKSEKRFDVLILRDPFNLFASRLRSGRTEMSGSKLKSLLDVWIEYAREYLGETNYLQNEKVLVNFNKWFAERDYRKSLAEKLGLDFSDQAVNQVTSFGRGSSFDGTKFDGNPQKMDLLGRWRTLSENPEYLQLVRNEEVRLYSEMIFGHIPGTEALWKKYTNL